MNSILTITLNPALDLIVDGKISRVYAGGKGINVARTMKKWGLKPQLFGIVGGNTGERLRYKLEKEFDSPCFYTIKEATRINKTYLNDASSRCIEKGPVISKKEFNGALLKLKQIIGRYHLIVISGSLPGNTKCEFYEKIVKMISKKLFVLDVSGENLKKLLRYKPFLIKPNRQEAEVCLKKKLKSYDDYLDAVYRLQKMGAQNVILSLDSEGALGLVSNKIYYFKGKVQKKGHAVGCGDVLLGSFLAHVNDGPAFALKIAVAAAGASLRQMKPGYFHKKDIFLDAVKNIS